MNEHSGKQAASQDIIPCSSLSTSDVSLLSLVCCEGATTWQSPEGESCQVGCTLNADDAEAAQLARELNKNMHSERRHSAPFRGGLGFAFDGEHGCHLELGGGGSPQPRHPLQHLSKDAAQGPKINGTGIATS